MAHNVTVKLDLPGVNDIVRKFGLEGDGEAQRFHTQNVLRRMQKFMPYRTGVLSTKIPTIQSNSAEIVVAAPYAPPMYTGIMHGKPINYNQQFATTVPRGAHWPERLVAHEGDAITQDLQDHVDRRTT
jgi:hypothetical protein